MIGITGATGATGRRVAERIAAGGFQQRLIVCVAARVRTARRPVSVREFPTAL